MSDEDFGAMSAERPRDAGPILQERKTGHALLALNDNVFVEVSKFHGKTYVSIRRWFQADDGTWYRTKNGLNLETTVFTKVFAEPILISVRSFIEEELKHLSVT